MQLILFFILTISSASVFSQTVLPTVSAQDAATLKPAVKEVEAVAPINEMRLGERDPFEPPKYIRDMEQVKPENIIDQQMEAIRRWPLAEYKLKGIIWDVKNPKAIITDKLNTLHMLKKNYRIGNLDGLISEINESEIVVIQKGVPTVLQIEKTSAQTANQSQGGNGQTSTSSSTQAGSQ